MTFGCLKQQGDKLLGIFNRKMITLRQAKFGEGGGARSDHGRSHGGCFDDRVSETLIRAGADNEFRKFVERRKVFIGNETGKLQVFAQTGMSINGRVERAGKGGVYGGSVACDNERRDVGIGGAGGSVGLEKEGEIFVEPEAADVEPETGGEIELGSEFFELFSARIERVVAREPVVDGIDLGKRYPVKFVQLAGGELRYGENPASFQLADTEPSPETGASGMIGRAKAVGITIVSGD